MNRWLRNILVISGAGALLFVITVIACSILYFGLNFLKTNTEIVVGAIVTGVFLFGGWILAAEKKWIK
jgi:hypothetical protein